MRSFRWKAGWVVLAMALAVAGCNHAGNSHSAAAAKERAKSILVSGQRLPEHYRVANGQDFPGEVKLCDLTLKPEGVRGFAMKRYTFSVIGPFLYQYVFVSSEDANRALLQRINRTLQNCHKDVVTTESAEKTTFRITPLRKLPRFGQGSTGFRRVPEREGVTSEYLLIRNDEVSVLLFTVAPKEITAPRELLVAGAGAVTRILEKP